MSSPVDSFELIFLGSGAASQCPGIGCLTRPESSCQACLSRGKNDRATASAVAKITYADQSIKTILIDCGTTFLSRARQIFPKHGLRRIDAVLLTHEHGDATSGLGSLQEWVKTDGIQDTMPIYANAKTYDEVALQWPFLQHPLKPFSKKHNAAFQTRLVHDEEAFELFGVRITPLPANHGMRQGKPNICLGWMFDRSIAYMSDSNLILDSAWKAIEEAHGLPVLVTETLRLQPHPSHFGFAQAVATARRANARKSYFTQIYHTFSHEQWIKCCEAIQSGRHAQKPRPVENLGGDQVKLKGDAFAALMDRTGFTKAEMLMRDVVRLKGIEPDDDSAIVELAMEEVELWEGGPQQPLWIRPAYDSLSIKVDAKTGTIQDGYIEAAQLTKTSNGDSAKPLELVQYRRETRNA